MNDSQVSKKLNWMICLLSANLLAMVAGVCALVFGLLPKVERAVQTTERVEARLQSFANDVQPVVAAGAGKAVETITNMDTDKMSKSATEGTNKVIDAAAEGAKRFLDPDKSKEP